MQKISKHRRNSIIEVNDLSGGLNYSKPKELLANNEFTQLDNFMYNPKNGLLEVRPPFTKVKDFTKCIGGYFGKDYMLVISHQKLYCKPNEGDFYEVGTITGNSDNASFAEWDDGVLITCGGSLHYLHNGLLKSTIPLSTDSIQNGVKPDIVFTRAGRAVVSKQGGDTLYYSGIADIENWTYDEFEHNAQHIEPGFKDGGDIVAIANLSQDIIVFKSTGNIYRIMGEFPDWQVLEITRGVECLPLAAVTVFNNVLFMSTNGLMGLETVQAYGSIQLNDSIGFKINPILRQYATSRLSKISLIPTWSAIIITFGGLNECYVLNIPNKSYTRWIMPFTPLQFGTSGGEIFCIATDGVYKVDNLYSEEKSDIQAWLTSKTFRGNGELLLKKLYLSASAYESSTLNVSIGKLSYSIPIGLDSDFVATDDDIAANDTDYLVSGAEVDSVFYDTLRGRDMTLTIGIQGKATVKNFKLEVAEVY